MFDVNDFPAIKEHLEECNNPDCFVRTSLKDTAGKTLKPEYTFEAILRKAFRDDTKTASEEQAESDDVKSTVEVFFANGSVLHIENVCTLEVSKYDELLTVPCTDGETHFISLRNANHVVAKAVRFE